MNPTNSILQRLRIRPSTIVDVGGIPGSELKVNQEAARVLATTLNGNVKLHQNGEIYLFDGHGNMVQMHNGI